MTSSKIDYLDVDSITVPGQMYALVSFVSPTSNQKNDKMGMKIRGVFASQEEANAHVKKLMQFDGTVDIYLMEMYKWTLIPPDADKIDDHVYQEEFLNTMMQEYKKNQAQAKMFFEERKRAVMEEGLDKHLLESERLPPPPEGSSSTVPDLAQLNDPHPSTSGAAAKNISSSS